MKLVYPDYYKKFNCIADKCEDTCCAGWEIVVDTDSADFYKSAEGEIGNRLRSEMKIDADGDIVFALKNGRCPFLNSTNLCDIYSCLGQSALCHTCKMFPRFIEEYGATCETGIGLACPEAARIIVENQDDINFLCEFNNEIPLPNEIDPELYFKLLSLRQKVFDEISSDNDFEAVLINILKLSGDADPVLPDIEWCRDVLLSLDILTNRWKELISAPIERKDFSHKICKLKNIAGYYIYRYFLKSVFDGDVLAKAYFCVFACVVINSLSDETNIADIAHLFSKEVEYSADNINIVFERLKNRIGKYNAVF